jgi:CheY-like chemotaxis protein/HPt (histidine-containing phosphotransfer) domain-containing protein
LTVIDDILRFSMIASSSVELGLESLHCGDLELKEQRASGPYGQEHGMCAQLAHPTADRRHLQILVAEDSVVNQKLTLHLLAQLGYQGDLVATGLEVIQALQRRHYDIVLMDVHMPEMDGCEATRRIHQQIPPAQRPRIIAMTASESDDDRAQCRAAGMDDYIGKPVQIAELQAVLQRWGHITMAPFGRADAATIPAQEFTSLTRLRAMQSEGILNSERDIVTELIDMFLEDTPPWLVALHEALRRADARAFTQAAHSLKGSCGTIGATHIATICAALEERGGQGHLGAVERSLDDLSAEFQRVRQLLEGIRQRP